MTYMKAALAVVAAALAALAGAITGDQHIDPSEWLNVLLMAAGAAAVFTAPNVPGARYTKTVLAVITAVATAAASLILDGVSLTDWIQLILAGFGAVGVYAAPYLPAGVMDGSFPRHAPDAG